MSANEEFVIQRARSSDSWTSFVDLTREYLSELDQNYRFRSMHNLFADPTGGVDLEQGVALLGLLGTEVAGVIGLRPLDDRVGELKRLFVRPAYRGRGLGTLLCYAAISHAKQRGYQAVRLDTTTRLGPAVRLYKGLGFHEIGAYNGNPERDARFFELNL